MNTFSTTRMRGCLCESCKREVGKEMFARGGGRRSCEVPTRTPACTYLLRRGRGRLTKTANRGGAPQASYDKRRHWNCFQTRPLQAFRKVNILWGQKSVDPIKLVYTWRSWTTHGQQCNVTYRKHHTFCLTHFYLILPDHFVQRSIKLLFLLFFSQKRTECANHFKWFCTSLVKSLTLTLISPP